MQQLISADQHQQWREQLALFPRVDVCHMPEYHEAYSLRYDGARALMWIFEDSGETLCYPFLLSPVTLEGDDGKKLATGWFEISGI